VPRRLVTSGGADIHTVIKNKMKTIHGLTKEENRNYRKRERIEAYVLTAVITIAFEAAAFVTWATIHY